MSGIEEICGGMTLVTKMGKVGRVDLSCKSGESGGNDVEREREREILLMI